jgi:hypothetical protein
MELTPELFERITGTSVPPQQAPAAGDAVLPVGARRVSDLRSTVRLGMGKRAKICPIRGAQAGVWQTVMMQDISVGGVGILCDEPMEIGDQFVLHVQDTQDQTVPLKCKVCRCEPGGFGGVSFVIGAQFAVSDEAISTPVPAISEMGNDITPIAPHAHSALVMASQQAGEQAASTRRLLQFFTASGESLRGVVDRIADMLTFKKQQDDFSAPTQARRRRRPAVQFKNADLASVRLGSLVCWP